MDSPLPDWLSPVLGTVVVLCAAAIALRRRSLVIWLGLLAAFALSLSSHSLVLSEWHAPTFGNALIHVANARHVLVYGDYPLRNDYSYGGLVQGLPNVYVPAYRMSLASTAALFGSPLYSLLPSYQQAGFPPLDGALDITSRLLVLLFALLLPAGFFLLGRELGGEAAGLLAALLCAIPAELLIYTVRPLPQAFGLAMLPFVFLELYRPNTRAALSLSLLLSLVHQEAALFFAACAFCYGLLLVFFESPSISSPVLSSRARLAFLCWAVCSAAYLGWQSYSLGSPNIFSLTQFKIHEGAPATFSGLVSSTGLAVCVLFVLTLPLLVLPLAARLANRRVQPPPAAIFIFASLLAGVLLVENNLLGIGVFMNRFVVYLQLPALLSISWASQSLLAKLKIHLSW